MSFKRLQSTIMDTRLTMCHRDQWTGGEFIVWVEYIGNGGMFVSIRSTGGGCRSE